MHDDLTGTVATSRARPVRRHGASKGWRRRALAQRPALEGAWASASFGRLIPVLLLAAAFALYLPRLTTPPDYFFDETTHAYTASQYLDGNEAAYHWDSACAIGQRNEECLASQPDAAGAWAVMRYEWTHPPLAMQLIAGGIFLFGEDAFGWRIASVVFGAIGIALMYRLGLALTGRRSVALLAAGLLLADGLYFVQSRTGVLDIFGTVFMMAALFWFAHYVRSPPERARWPLIWTGTFLGLGLAVKWNAAFAAVLICGVALWRLFTLWRDSRGEDAQPAARIGLRQHLLWVPVGLLVIPLAIHVIVHIPFFLEGYGLAEFVELNRQRFEARRAGLALPAFNPDGTWHNEYSSRWWQWPLALRPLWYGQTTTADMIAVTYAKANPLLYWAFVPAVFWLCWRWWRARHPALVVLLIGFFGQWLPWIFLSHTAFVYHFLPAVPFGCLAVAMAVAELCRGNTGWRRTLAIEYVVLVALAFAFFYPIYSHVPLSEHGFEIRMWLSSWR